MDEERVIDKGCAFDDFSIILRHRIAEALADGPQARGFRRDLDFLWKVGTMDDQGQAVQRGIVREVLVDKLLERTPPALILVRIARARRVEANRLLLLLNSSNLLWLDEHDLR